MPESTPDFSSDIAQDVSQDVQQNRLQADRSQSDSERKWQVSKLAGFFIAHRWPWLTASILLTGVLFIFSSFGWYWYTDQRTAAERQLSLDMLWLQESIADTLNGDKKLLMNWSSDLPLWSASNPTRQQLRANDEFVSRITGMIKENPALLAIEYLDQHGQRITGLPLYKGNKENKGDSERPERLPPLSDPLINEALQSAIHSASPVYTQVIEQYAPLWVLVIPLINDGEIHGSLLATYDLNLLLSQKVPWWFIQRYDLVLTDRNNKQLSPGEEIIAEPQNGQPAREVYKLAFGPENSGLSLRASPHLRGQSKILLGYLALAVFLLGALVIFLLRILQRWLHERQQVQQALAQELRFREAMEQSLVTGLLAFDSQARIIYANHALCSMLGLSHQSLINSHAPFPFWPRDHLEQCQQAHRAMLAGDNPAGGRNLNFLHANGSHLSVRLFASPLTFGDQKTSGWMVSLYDTTAELQAANTARERDELLQHTSRLATLAEFASGIAHELNQPLAAIANYSAAADSFLAAEPLQKNKVQQAVQKMGEESRRAGQIIHSMRSFIQRRTVQHEKHNLCNLLEQAMALLTPLLQRQNMQILTHTSAADICIECDAVMIEQVLFNLLRNAIESLIVANRTEHSSTTEDYAISLTIMQEAGNVLVSVTDHGAGIADHSKLFQAFYTTKSEGMGLGLAICRTVVESHGGRLWAEDNPAGGAVFKFRLPCLPSA